MKAISNLKVISAISLLFWAILFNNIAHAHSAGSILGIAGTNPSAMALAAITCFNDGNGEPAGLYVEIKDTSPPIPGLLISVILYKGAQATSISDTNSGDADFSRGIQLNGGAGVYRLMLNKTDTGPRAFDLIWHCMTSDNFHTGTDITLQQFD